ncbi:adenosine monophosphate transferase FICD like [Fusarium beomiforme]|uniref:Adenosine monophosphate transferase FICD like n=1 Tax=Fusarium beomiforme TaxID=44412 RepID=A0A9P5A5F9_9HYPO|nr:adenosine monophosphate transferase FICD like [Fusarium beomiforme]
MAPNLGNAIRIMLSSLHGGGSVRVLSLGKESTLLLTQDDGQYEHDQDEDDSDETIELRKYLEDVTAAMKSSNNDSKVDEFFNERLSQMVYGSNMIESVGGSLEITVKLCQPIFEGQYAAISDPTYQVLQMKLIKKNKSSGHEDTLRSWREIIQHAKATYYIMNEVVIKGNDLSEEIILETHRLLTYKINSPDGIPWSEYGGIYRTCPVQRGFHSFPHQNGVPKAVRDLTSSLKADIAEAEASGAIDPVALAAKYCHKFVNIHPFFDGNSRTSRLILNSILLKYGGCFVCLGIYEEDCEEYLEVSAQGFSLEAMALQQEDLDDLPEDYRPEDHKKLATFILKHVQKIEGILINFLGTEELASPTLNP